MFGLFGRRRTAPTSDPLLDEVRSRTRDLVRLANIADTVDHKSPNHDVSGAASAHDAARFGEIRLASCITAAIRVDPGIDSKLTGVVARILDESTVVSATAHASVRRAMVSGQQYTKQS